MNSKSHYRGWLREFRRAWMGCACLTLLLEGCAAGPNFSPPSQPTVKRYSAAQTPRTIKAGDHQPIQSIRLGLKIAGQWWTLFRSPALNQVLSKALSESPTLASARATLAAAQANVAAARGGYYPQADLSANARRGSGSQMLAGGAYINGNGTVYDLYSVGPTVSYEPDVFGTVSRQVEAQQALADKQRYNLDAAWLTLTGNSVTQALTIASARAQIKITQAIVAQDLRNLSLVREKYLAGKAALTDVLTARTQLAADKSTLPPLQQQLVTARHALSVLAGASPARWSPPAFSLQDFTLPGKVPLSLPSALVRQRPDILAAEAQLHADSAAIGIAAAKLYPSITLSAAFGQQSPATATLFDTVNQFWNLAAGLAMPLFHGGTLRAQQHAATEVYRASLATYEQTVLSAFEQVADNLQSLEHDAKLTDDQYRLLAIAKQSLELQRLSYRAGKSNVLDLINAQRVYDQARLGYVRAQVSRLQDTAHLLVALGGGWWNNVPPTSFQSGDG